MKKCFCILALSVIVLLGFAQDRAAYKDAIKLWNEGPVTESDFSVRHLANTLDNISGSLDWGIRFEHAKDKIGNLRYIHPVSYTYMDKLNSWRDPDYAHPWSMDYFQTVFDLVEINRRKMQADLDAHPQDYQEIKDYYSRSINSLTEALIMESDRGNDAAAVARYEVQCKEDLDAWEESPLEEPVIQRTALGIGIYAGYEGEYFTHPLSEVLGMRHLFEIGWVIPVKQFYTSLGIAAALKAPVKADALLHDRELGYDWRKSEPYTGGQFHFRLGYRAVDQPRIALIPFAGIGGSFIDQDTGWKDADGKDVTSRCGGIRLQGGIMLHWKYLRDLTFRSYEREYGEHALAFRLYGARTNFKGIEPVWSINFGVCIDLTSWPVKAKLN